MGKKVVLFAAVLALAAASIVVTLQMIGSADSLSSRKSPAAPESLALPIADDSMEVKVSLPMFYRLNEHYIRGAQPAHGGVAALARLGVRTIVDLRSAYDRTHDIGIAAESYGLRYVWLPMSVWEPPTDAEANKFISLVSDSSNGPFFVFCADGMHRAGEMSAIYRVAHDGWNVEQALKEMDQIGFNPYYYTLRNYVWTYARKHRPAAVPAGARRMSVFEKQK